MFLPSIKIFLSRLAATRYAPSASSTGREAIAEPYDHRRILIGRHPENPKLQPDSYERHETVSTAGGTPHQGAAHLFRRATRFLRGRSLIAFRDEFLAQHRSGRRVSQLDFTKQTIALGEGDAAILAAVRMQPFAGRAIDAQQYLFLLLFPQPRIGCFD